MNDLTITALLLVSLLLILGSGVWVGLTLTGVGRFSWQRRPASTDFLIPENVFALAGQQVANDASGNAPPRVHGGTLRMDGR